MMIPCGNEVGTAFCKKCSIIHAPVYPQGTRTPTIYFVAETPGENEVADGIPLSPNGRSGEIFRQALVDQEIPETLYRVNNVVMCRAEDQVGANRNPDSEEIANCVNHLKADILKSKPRVIVLMGASAIAGLFPYLETSVTKTRLRTDLTFEGIPVRTAFHPSYIARKGGTRSREYREFCKDIQHAWELSQGIVRFDSKVECRIFEAKEIDQFVEAALAFQEDTLGLDYEANQSHPLNQSYLLAGVGIADSTGGIYLSLKHHGLWDTQINNDIRTKLHELIEHLDQDKRLVVFNAKYELPVTSHQFSYKPKNIMDVMQQGVTLNLSGRLKDIARAEMGVPNWEADVELIVSNFNALLQLLKPTKRYRRKEEELLQAEGIEVMMDQLEETSLNELAGPDGKPGRATKIRQAVTMLERYYGYSDLQILLIYLIDKENWTFSYEFLPLEVIAPYCCSDACYTVKLYHHFHAEIMKRGLEKAEGYYNQHIYLGSQMECAGCQWDDEEATRIGEQYEKDSVDALRNFLLTERAIALLELGEQDILDIQSTTEIDVLKGYFNPNNTQKKNTQKLSELLTTSRMRLCLLALTVWREVEIDQDKAELEMPLLVPIVKEFKETRNINDFRVSVKSSFESNKLNTKEVRWVGIYSQWVLPDAQAETVQELMDAALTFTDSDIDKPETLENEIAMLFYYKKYKKIDKASNTFLNGSAGRGCVSVLDPENMDAGEPIRLGPYVPDKPDNLMYLWATSFGVNWTVTRRWSSGAHNMPPESEIRRCMKSKFPGGFVLHADYSQMELRVLAAMCNEEAMLAAFRSGADIHKANAALIFNVTLEDVTKEQRSWAKNGTFGIVYQQGIHTFADTFLHGDVVRAQYIFDSIYTRYPRIRKYIEARKKEVRERNAVKTLWGDDIPIIFDPDSSKEYQAEAERTAVNYPIQGSASNVSGLSIARINDWLIRQRYLSRSFMFTHDSMDIDTHPNELFALGTTIPTIAEQAPLEEFNLPIKLDLSLGVSSGQQVELSGIDHKPVFYTENGSSVLHASFEGQIEDVKALVLALGNISEVEYEIHSEEDSYMSNRQLFALKGGYTKRIGKTLRLAEGEILAKAL